MSMTETQVAPQLQAISPNQEVLMVVSGDLRESANKVCWEAQEAVEKKVVAAFAAEGITVRRAHPYKPERGHGFIATQREGLDIFEGIDPEAPVIVVEAVWQYSHNVFGGLRTHRGPILTIANWSGLWPGLVGMLNLNGCLYKAGVPFSTIWSKDFDDDYFRKALREWLKTGRIVHDLSHVHELIASHLPAKERELGAALAGELLRHKAILGVFDEGCMGMYNAILEDDLLNPVGVFKERLSQSALVAAMHEVSDAEAQKVRNWLDARGMTFVTGPNEETDLTDRQILEQAKMYIAAVRIASSFGCDMIGIQYQQGLKDCVPASDLVEGLLNNVERPPVFSTDGRELYAGKALPHFNEVDEGAALDLLVTNRVWTALGYDPASTLHDVRWGEDYHGDGIDGFVWLFQISGAVPASHLVGGYAGASSERQPPMYFRLGGGTLKGVCKPGAVVWSRVFAEGGRLHADLGLATSVALPPAETERRWREATTQWPIMNLILEGVGRNEFMSRHHANHANVAYAPDAAAAKKALQVKAAMFEEMGVQVHLCGVDL